MDFVISPCLWCSNPAFMENHLHDFLFNENKKSKTQTQKKGNSLLKLKRKSWYEQAYDDLLCCFDCVQVYHQLVKVFLSCNISCAEQVYLKTVKRVTMYLQECLKKDSLKTSCSTSLKEVFAYPRLLLDKKLNDVVVLCLQRLLSNGEAEDVVSEKLPGIYLLLVHPDKQVSRWAIGVVKSLGPLDLANYEEIEEVIKWLMTIISFNLFLEAPSMPDSSVWLPGELVCLPTYTYAYQSPKDFWVGICMLITVMNPVCIRSQLLSSTSEHKYLIDSVLNALDTQDTTCFWPLLQIFATLLNRLDWRIWQLTQKSPSEVCKMFLSHQVFIHKLQQWSAEDKLKERRNKDDQVISDQEDWVSNSQMVYEWSTRTLSPTLPSSSHDSSKDEDTCSPHVVVFMWVLPFIHSLLEFGNVLENDISQVLSAIRSIFSLSLCPKPYFKVSILTGLVSLSRQRIEPSELLEHLSIDGLSNKSLHIIAQLIEMLFTNEKFSFLLEEKKKWLPIFSSVCEVILSGKLSVGSTSPCSQSFKLASSVLPSSIVAVRKTMYIFFNNSVGQQCEIYSQVVVYFSPKLNRSTLFTPPLASNSISVPQKLTVENLQEAILNILKIYKSNQDITGPFLPFGNSQDSVKKSTIVKQEVNYDEEPSVKKSTIVKQEVNYDEEPSVKKSTIVKQEVNYDEEPSVKKSTIVKQEVNDDEESSEVIVKKEVSYENEHCEMECRDELPDSTFSMSPESCYTNTLFGEPSHQIHDERTCKIQLNLSSSEDSDDSVEIVAVYPAKKLMSSSSSDNSLPSVREIFERTPVNQQQQNATKLDISCNEKKSSKNKVTRVRKRKPLKCKRLLFKSSSSDRVPSSDWSNGDSHVSNNSSKESAINVMPSLINLDDNDDQCNNLNSTTLKKSSLITSNTPFLSSPEFSDDDNNEAATKTDTREFGSKQVDDKITAKIQTHLDNAEVMYSQASDLTNWCSNFDASSTLESLAAISAYVEPCKTTDNEDSATTSICTELPSSDYLSSVMHPMDTVSESDGKLSPFLQSPDSQMKADYVFEDISTQVDSIQSDSNSSDEENAIATAARKSAKDSNKLERTLSQSHSLSPDLLKDALDSSFVEVCDKDKALACIKEMSAPMKQIDPFELLSQDPDAYIDIPRTTPQEIKQCTSMKRTHIASESDEEVLSSAKKRNTSLLSISGSETEPSDHELDSTKVIPKTIYNHSFVMPTCASRSSDLIMPNYKRVRPLKLKLRRLQSNDIKKIHYQIQEKKIAITPCYERYKRQCEAFLEAQGVPQSIQTPLTVTVPLSFLPTRKNISEENNLNALNEMSSDEVFTDSQVSIGNEYLVTSSGGTAITLGHGSSISQKQLSSSIPMRQTNTSANLGRDKKLGLSTKELPTPAKSNTESKGTCYHAPPFSRSRLPSPIVEKPSTGAKQKANNLSHATNTSSNKKTISRVTTTTDVVPFYASPSMTVPATASSSMTVPATASTSMAAKHIVLSSRSQAINLKPKQKRQFEDLFYHFLNWDPDIFLNLPLAENGCPMKPNLILENEPTPVLEVYQCYEQYFETMKPLLLLELWDMIYEALSDLITQQTTGTDVHITPASLPLGFLTCQASLPERVLKNSNYFSEYHLVLVKFITTVEESEENIDYNIQPRFALIQQCLPHPPTRTKETAADPKVELSLKLWLMAADLLQMNELSNIKFVHLYSILNLSTILWEWKSLINIHQNILARDILCPRGGVYFGLTDANGKNKSPEHEKTLYDRVYNESQFSAIQLAVELVKQPYTHPRFLLIQGPHGTGKTHTIVGIIEAILKSLKTTRQEMSRSTLPNSSSNRVSHPHILVCAPSNPAVDEIIRRLIKDGLVSNIDKTDSNSKSEKDCGFNVVRIGHRPRIHKDIQSISLDVLVDKNNTEENDMETKRKIQKLQESIAEVEKKRSLLNHKKLMNSFSHRSKSSNDDSLFQKLHDEKLNLERHLKPLLYQCRRSHHSKEVLSKNILLNADVICCTLSTSGKGLLSCLKKSPLHFSCVIIDEATQCNELDVLIPLCCGCSKAILVGDLIQFSGTAKSTRAENLGYGQSLLSRMSNFFSSQDNNPVHMLQVQYRMVPDICCFPSQHFYRGRLLTSRSLKTGACDQYGLKHLQLFDVIKGKEVVSQESRSLSNKEECKLVMELVDVLLHRDVPPSQLGIITPYHTQERLILSELRKRFQCKRIDVGTVECFQGREKDVIILTCVRTSDEVAPKGFLSHSQKMNVALTRAKMALYILGHCNTLKMVNEDWSALIQYATNTHVITKCVNTDYMYYAQSVLSGTYESSISAQSVSWSNSEKTVSENLKSKQETAIHSYTIGDPRLDCDHLMSKYLAGGSHIAAAGGTCDNTSISMNPNDSKMLYSNSNIDCDDKSISDPVSVPLSSSVCSSNAVTSTDKLTNNVEVITLTDKPTSFTANGEAVSSTNHVVSTELTSLFQDDSASDIESYRPTMDHDAACHWPDSQSVSRPELPNYHDMDYSKRFPSPPRSIQPLYKESTWRPYGGPRKRTAHASKEEISLIRSLAPDFRELKKNTSTAKRRKN